VHDEEDACLGEPTCPHCFDYAGAVAACGLSRKAIYRAIENGELRAAKVCRGRRLLITTDELRAWIERSFARPVALAPRVADDLTPRRAARTPLRDTLREIEAA
jgi:excisionase family DNA binding protein